MTTTKQAEQTLQTELDRLASLKAELNQRTIELARARSNRTDPESQMRVIALEKAIEALHEEIEKAESDYGPIAQARAGLLELKRQREGIEAHIAEIEALARPYGDMLPDIEKAAQTLVNSFRRAGTPQRQAEFERWSLAIMLWARGLRGDLATLPGWKARLED